MDKQIRIWEGVFDSFAEAGGEETVFEGDVWLNKINARARAALASSESECAIPPVAETRDYALPYVAALVARPGQALRILDFGGGMATSYLPLVEMLPPDQPLQYVIVENEAVCRAGGADGERSAFALPDRIFRSRASTAISCIAAVRCTTSTIGRECLRVSSRLSPPLCCSPIYPPPTTAAL